MHKWLNPLNWVRWFWWWLETCPAIVVRCGEPSWDNVWAEAFLGEFQYCVLDCQVKADKLSAFLKRRSFFWPIAPVIIVSHWNCHSNHFQSEDEVVRHWVEVTEMLKMYGFDAYHLHLSTTKTKMNRNLWLDNVGLPKQAQDALGTSEELRLGDLTPTGYRIWSVLVTNRPLIDETETGECQLRLVLDLISNGDLDHLAEIAKGCSHSISLYFGKDVPDRDRQRIHAELHRRGFCAAY